MLQQVKNTSVAGLGTVAGLQLLLGRRDARAYGVVVRFEVFARLGLMRRCPHSTGDRAVRAERRGGRSCEEVGLLEDIYDVGHGVEAVLFGETGCFKHLTYAE